MFTLVFVFLLFNLTIIWNLPTISIGERGRDGVLSLVGLLSNPLVPPFEVDHHRSSCCLSSFNQSMRAMLTLVFVFMLFNLTSIWNLPTISTGDHGHDGIPSLVGFFVRGRTQKVAPQGIP